MGVGYESVIEALKTPLRLILTHGGWSEEEINKYIDSCKNDEEGWGYNYQIPGGRTHNSMIDDNVIDPVKVLKEALMNACSVSGKVILTETVLY